MAVSRLQLPKLDSPPGTILEHLIARFPHVSPEVWRERIARGLVTFGDGTPLKPDSGYRCGVQVLYQREVPDEPAAPDVESILYRDEEILVADKPHGMPVTPAGDYMDRSLLVRLQRSTGIETIAPIHRLDKDTAGVVLFTFRARTRGPYHQMFLDRTVTREYIAGAKAAEAPIEHRWLVESRIVRGTPWFRQQIVAGSANAITEIELLGGEHNVMLFRLMPQTGKKHQLRLHMASIGFPILGDPLYPEPTPEASPMPLQLLARRLGFIDPLSGTPREFVSARKLLCLSLG